MAKLVYQRKNGKWEARYRKGTSKDGKPLYGAVYGETQEEAILRRSAILESTFENNENMTEMNLLILGAGIHGQDIREIAQTLRVFNKIDFLDDNIQGESVIGKCSDVALFRKKYPCAFVAIGNNEIRKKYSEMIKKLKFLTPSIVSLSANVSPRAKIGSGVAILSQATVNEGSIGDFCIIDSGGLINSGAVVGEYSRIDCGAIVSRNVKIEKMSWIKPGNIKYSEKSSDGLIKE